MKVASKYSECLTDSMLKASLQFFGANLTVSTAFARQQDYNLSRQRPTLERNIVFRSAECNAKQVFSRR